MEFLGRMVSEVLPPDVASVVAVSVEQTFHTGGCSGATYSLRMGDGTTQWFELTGARQGSVDDPDARAILLVRDITQRKEAEERHHRSEERLNEVVRLSMFGIFEHDHLNDFVYWSPELRAIYGWDPVEPATLDRILMCVHPDDLPGIGAAVKAAHDPNGDGQFDVSHRIIVRDGGVRWVETRSRTYFEAVDGVRRPVRTVGAVMDVTAAHLAAEELRKARDELEVRVEQRTVELERAMVAAEAANHAKSRFLAMMSHEIRTPLNGINGVLHLLRGERLTDEQSHWVGLAHASAGTLLRVINDILDFSKIEAGKLEIRPGPTDLHALVYRTAGTFAESATAKQLTWAVTVHPDVPRLVRTDEVRVSQILGNLINNAVTFTDAGTVTIQVGSTPQAGWVRFDVTDTGHGVSTELQDRLFKPFSQLDTSNSRRHGGTGLGLGICKQLVELLDGRIGMESGEQGGCTFWFELPLPPEVEPEAEVSPAPPADARPAGRLKVLVAEDNPINQLLAREMVQRAGFDCDCVGTGHEAVVAASTGAYATILMDCMMPELDGFEATRLIREDESLHPSIGHVPIIALTARAMAGDREECLAAGMDDYLSKPFAPDDVANMLRRWTRAPGV